MNENINKNSSNNGELNQLSLRSIFDFLLCNWYWLALSVTVFLVAGYIVYKTSPKIYRAQATVFIDEDNSRGVGPGLTDMRVTRTGFNQGRKVDNELYFLRSRSLMYQTVEALNANVHYFIKARLRYVEFYVDNSPLLLTTDSLTQPFEIDIKRFTQKDYTGVVHYKINGKKIDKPVKAAYGERIAVGNATGFTVTANRNFDKYVAENGNEGTLRISVDMISSTMGRYMGNTSIGLLDKVTSVVFVEVKDPVPQRCADVINTLIKFYNDDAVQSKQAEAIQTSAFITERLMVIDEELSSVDGQMEALKRGNNSVNIGTEAGMYIANSNRYQEELNNVILQQSLVGMVREYLVSNRGEVKTLPNNLGIEDAGLNMSISKYNELVMQRTRLGGDAVQGNPTVIDLTAQILDMQVSILGSIDNITSSLNMKRRSVEKQIQLTSSKVSSVPALERQTLDIARNQQIKDALYSFLLNRREEANLKFASAQPLGNIIDAPLTSSSPISPRRSYMLLIFLVVGIMLPVVIILLTEALRTTINSVHEVENNVLEVPLIGIIPSKSKGNKNEIVVTSTSNDPISEAFRMVRTNIDFIMPVGGKTIMVTSSIPGEAKSFVSINMALTLGISGKRVLLIDLDMRKATLSERVSGKSQKRGIVNYLVGKEDDIMSLVSRQAMGGVDLLYVGTVPPNPSELLSSERFKTAINTVKAHYDYVILDTPPIGLVTDAVVANPVADVTLFALRINKTPRRALNSITSTAKQGRLKNMGIIISDVGATPSYSRYRENYYSYGYGYGYGQSKNSFWKRIRSVFKKH